MLGFFIGLLCLIGLIAVVRGGRRCGRRFDGRHCGGHHGGRHHHGHDHDGHDHEGRHGRGGFRGFGRGGARAFLRVVFEKLDTTPGQEKEITAAVEDFVQHARSLKQEGKSSRDDVAALLRTESLDEDVLGGLFSRHDERLREVQKAFADTLGRIHQALDPRQRERLAEMIESGEARGFGGPYRGWA